MRIGLAIPQYGFSLPSGEISFADTSAWAQRAEALGLRLGLALRPLLLLVRALRGERRAHRGARAVDDARGARRRDRAGPPGRDRAGGAVPAPGAGCEGGGDDRPDLRRTRRDRPGRRLARAGVRRVRLRVRLRGGAIRCAGGCARHRGRSVRRRGSAYPRGLGLVVARGTADAPAGADADPAVGRAARAALGCCGRPRARAPAGTWCGGSRPEDYAGGCRACARRVRRVGRDPATFGLSVGLYGIAGRTEDEARATFERAKAGFPGGRDARRDLGVVAGRHAERLDRADPRARGRVRGARRATSSSCRRGRCRSRSRSPSRSTCSPKRSCSDDRPRRRSCGS